MGSDIDVAEDGAVRLSGTPYLAGSTLRLCDAVQNTVAFAGATFGEAIRMATVNPAGLLGMGRERGLLRVGARADLTVFRRCRGRYELTLTVIGGGVCYQV
jgi:N-acetylglucosamine-6-phosphate deacetylase